MFKKERKILIATIILLITIYILNIIDYLQTVYAIQLFGIGVEANPIGRFCFEHNCAGTVKLAVVPIMLAVIGFIIIKVDTRYILVPCILFIFYVAVVWHNFVEMTKMGITNFAQLDEQIMTAILIICAIVTVVCNVTTVVLCVYYRHLKKK